MSNKKNNVDNKRGDTFVGYRPNVMKDEKDKANSRQARKKEARRIIRDDYDGR